MKKELLKYHLIFLLITSILISASAQPKTFNLVDLKDKTWSIMGLINDSSKETYESDKIILRSNEVFIGRMEYYLSDSICKVFDSSKVGSVLSGTYIVRRPLRDKKHPNIPLKVSCYEIIELSPAKLILRNRKNQLLEYKADTSVILKSKRKN